jgi:opacity protein-like surface antigen
MKRSILLCVAMVAASSAAAQSADTPLDLSVPAPAAAPAATDVAAKSDPPGTYYGDTSGKPSRRAWDEPAVEDDGKAKVWGSFTAGIGHTKGYGTSHYNAAEVNVSKSFGEGERPNAFNLQIRVEQGDGPGFGGYYPDPYFDRGAGYYPPRR